MSPAILLLFYALTTNLMCRAKPVMVLSTHKHKTWSCICVLLKIYIVSVTQKALSWKSQKVSTEGCWLLLPFVHQQSWGGEHWRAATLTSDWVNETTCCRLTPDGTPTPQETMWQNKQTDTLHFIHLFILALRAAGQIPLVLKEEGGI